MHLLGMAGVHLLGTVLRARHGPTVSDIILHKELSLGFASCIRQTAIQSQGEHSLAGIQTTHLDGIAGVHLLGTGAHAHSQ